MTAISSRYKDIISRSTLIISGPPAVYQLNPKKEEIDTLTRVTVGERKVNRTNRTILLVGETGTGKSTLVNALVNYTMGVKWEDGVWFQIVEEEERRIQTSSLTSDVEKISQSENRTPDVIVYEIFGFEGKTLPYSLTIIDTPGYGDTRGVKHENIVSQRLLKLFQSDGINEIHAVGLVMKASENRVTDHLRYTFSSVMSLFGRNMEKNIVTLITYSDGKPPQNALDALEVANIKCAINEKNEPVHFLFNNQQKTERTEENELVLQTSWKVTEKGMNKFTGFLETSKAQNLMKTVGVLDNRSKLMPIIQQLKDTIKLAELKQTEINETEEALKKHEEEMKNNEKFTIEVDEVYEDKIGIKVGMWQLVGGTEIAFCCTACEETCHCPVTYTWLNPFKNFEVMKNGRCTVCTNKCPSSDHVYKKWKNVTKTRIVQKTLEEIKEKFEMNKSEKEKKLILLENLKTEMNQLRAEQKKFLDESYQHVVKLEQLALKADSAATIVHLDFLIEKMKEEGDTDKVQKLEEMRSKMNEGTRAALTDMFDKMFTQ